MNDIINSTLAAKFSLHQEKQLSVADGLAETVDSKLQTVLNRMIKVLRSKAGPTEKKYAIRADLYKVILITNEIMARGLAHMATSSHADAATVLVKTIPKGHLGLITERKPILEDRRSEMEDQIKDMIFDPLPPDKIATIVRGTTAGASWQSRLAQQTSLAPPEHLATILTQDFNGQKSPAELARVLKDHVQGVASTARRVARNESMRIAHESRMDAYEDLGDMVVGYQIHATMDTRVRPHHAARSGTVYYKKPVSGQLGLDKMPRPPIEEDGTVAHNCRCWITPVLSINQEIEKDPTVKKVFSDKKGKLIPNPAVYTDWFDRAPEADKARVVGPKRLKVMRNQLLPGEKINWGHFVNPATGRLLDVTHLENETFEARQKRLKKFTQLIWKRKQLTHKIYTYGYLPPKKERKKSNLVKKTPAPKKPKSLVKRIEPTLPPTPATPLVPPAKIAGPEILPLNQTPTQTPTTPKVIDLPKHLNTTPPRTTRIQDTMLQSTSSLNDIADELGISFKGVQTPDERKQLLATVEKKLGGYIAQIIDKGKPKIRTTLDGIIGIIEDDKFKTQFETGTSQGALSNQRRREVEFNNIGVPNNHPSNERPVYGYIHKDGDPDHTKWYGKFQFILKPETLNFATITYGDSLNEAYHIVASPARNPSGFSVPLTGTRGLSNTNKLKRLESSDEYLEAQFHDKLTLDHVESLVINMQPPTTNPGDVNASSEEKKIHQVLEAMQKRGINVTFKK
jgi:hypothetical protein